MITFAIIILLFCWGYLILSLLNVDSLTWVEKLVFSWGIGTGFVMIQLTVYGVLGIPLYGVGVIIPWIVITSLFFIYRKKGYISMELPGINRWQLLLLFLLLCIFVYVIVQSTLRPLLAWDAWANWFLAAKAYYFDHSLQTSYLFFSNNSNPPGFSLLLSLLAEGSNGFSSPVIMLIYPVYYICTTVLLYSAMRKFTSRTYALFFSFLFAITPNIIRHAGRYDIGHSDLILSYYFLSSAILLHRFIKRHSSAVLILFGFYLGFATLVKNEAIPFMMISVAIAGFSILRTRRFNYLVLLSVPFLVLIPWQVFSRLYELPVNPFIMGDFHGDRLFIIVKGISREIINVVRWNMLWIVFCFSLVFTPLKNNIFLTLFLLQLTVYIFVYFLTPLPVLSHMQSSFDRLLIQIVPLAFLVIASRFEMLSIRKKPR